MRLCSKHQALVFYVDVTNSYIKEFKEYDDYYSLKLIVKLKTETFLEHNSPKHFLRCIENLEYDNHKLNL